VSGGAALEAIVLFLGEVGIQHVFPHGRETVRATWDPDLDPAESIVDAVAALGLVPMMVHSTSWRVVGREVLLTFLVIVEAPPALPPSYELEPVSRAELARGHATASPAVVHLSQVVEHALRHLAWLVGEDDAIRGALPGWSGALDDYDREPFRAFGPGSAT
jgi:hypothetical protein